MTQRKDTWTEAHDLALIYVALAYGTDHDLSDEELSTITDCLAAWDNADAADAQETVMEAVAVYLEGDAGAEVARSVSTLAQSLSVTQRRRALEDVMRVAEADGVLLSSEQSLISTLAGAWHVKATEQELIDHATATVEAVPSWSLLHDLGLLYLVVAHGADGELTDPEIAAMIGRMQEWQPDLEEEDARSVLRSVLQFYAEEPGEEALGRSVGALKEALPLIQRLVVLDDLTYIANADGTYDDNEQELITSLADAWNVSVRLNGQEERC